ncbi:MAG: gliding motility-associated protein GldE [Flavobacteriaceae bacterium CG_4_8_14_3_um_filter_34_10]|nr:MAG: magnesium/cobalt efflux protein [Flavobacteriaceae bacterium CG18_big_fil_WC_8_21_14_2_50_34_36]PIV48754.1 MAG: gliding motility-associated protein GldE [Flavobacteriaceae bacterium CG02_land_8_20_14_3_00_34_13]PIX09319.1 MAG: gliding motility-associated protein GldE [Flavobacteriaceae bacterium CG_4_8_14_3_um_filter_34_10]PIZ08139.1 MAG: gliding motility-associated protein GldE [Flavobacteriaceae bacterium CG_4_10_14_0_8_um_filter_34_31]PJC07035.1 MAG: gliding motility-associated prote
MDLEPPSLTIIPIIFEFAQFFGILSLLLLLLFSALISGAEVALFSLTPTDFELDPAKRSKKQIVIIKLLDRPKKLLATILVANNTINIAIVILFESLSNVWFQNLQTSLTFHNFTLDLVFFIKVGLATFIILLFGEILPKIYASRNKMKFSLFIAYPIKVLDVLLSPISLPMRSVTLYIHQKFGKQKTNLSVDQLSQALELTSEEDTTKEEQKILQGIVSFGNTDTKQVMKPRMDIFALRDDLPYKDVLPQIIEQGYSRIPVYKENMDTIIGILYVKDLIPYIDRKQFNWISLVREPFFVPENKKLDDLLNEFKEKRIHLAIVVDEYGGTCGVISLEDIIEEIVGDISDEFDDEDLIFSKLDDHNFVFEGKTPLKDFYRVIKLEDPSIFEEEKGEAETIAGFLLEISKGFPKKGEVIIYHNYSFTVEIFENKRIKQIKLSITPN